MHWTPSVEDVAYQQALEAGELPEEEKRITVEVMIEDQNSF